MHRRRKSISTDPSIHPRLKFQYQYKNQEPFQVTAIFHDESFTYIH